MEQPTAKSREQCPLDKSHESHFWRYEDEPQKDFKLCNGLCLPFIDVYERPVSGN